MGWGTAANVTTNHLNSATDDPSQARVELYNALVELLAVINGRNTANGVAGLDAGGKVPNTILPNTLISSATNDLTITPATGRMTIQNIVNLTPRTVAQLEALTATAGDLAYCSDGAAGSACLAVSKGETDSSGNAIWYRIALGAEISVT